MLAITGDTHGIKERFSQMETAMKVALKEGDYLFICGDFGYIFKDDLREQEFLDILAEKPYILCWIDGNHENFDAINSYPVEEWCGGKVHIIRRDKQGVPKIIHLMRGQIYEIEGKKIFTFGGAYSMDKALRTPYRSWWPQEMPTEEEIKEAIDNITKNQFEVDYVITHTAPEDTMNIFHPYHPEEKPLNNFLEWVRENVKYKHWYMGHLHQDEDLWRRQTVLLFDVRNMETNESLIKENQGGK